MNVKHADLCPRVENYFSIYALFELLVCPHRITQRYNSIDETALPDSAKYIPSTQKKFHCSNKEGMHAAAPKLKSHVFVV